MLRENLAEKVHSTVYVLVAIIQLDQEAMLSHTNSILFSLFLIQLIRKELNHLICLILQITRMDSNGPSKGP